MLDYHIFLIQFGAYWSDLKACARREGFHVDREHEWQSMIDHYIAEGKLPESARSWSI